MKNDIVFIINNKLYDYKYINYTVIFIITVLYSYYSLYISLLHNNYYIIIIYFSIIIISYIKYENFSYVIGFVYLLTYEILNNYMFKHSIIEANGSYERAQEKSKKTEQEMKASAENTDSVNNPCETYITNRLMELGVKISSKKYAAPEAEKTPKNAPTIDTIVFSTPAVLDLRNSGM